VTFFVDPNTGLSFAQDSRDGGLVVVDPSSHGTKYARHLLRGRDIAIVALRQYLQPVSDPPLIARALSEYQSWLEDAPRQRRETEFERAREQLETEAREKARAKEAEAESRRIKESEEKADGRLRRALERLAVSKADVLRVTRAIVHLGYEDEVMKLAEGKPIPLEVHDGLRRANLSALSAEGYEIAMQFGGDEVNKALGAARSWRMSNRPRRALQVLDPLRTRDLDPPSKAMVLTAIAAALADLGELPIARACANEALRSSPFRPDYPERVLARVAMLEGRFSEGLTRFNEADRLESKYWNAVARLEAAFTGDADNSENAALEAARQNVIPSRPATYDEFLQSTRWKDIRDVALARANWRCENCESSLSLEVHHRSYDRFGGAETRDDLEVLCRSCHEETHNWQALYVARMAVSLAH
jgi:tetratricopeptide (TPR) repeat protein